MPKESRSAQLRRFAIGQRIIKITLAPEYDHVAKIWLYHPTIYLANGAALRFATQEPQELDHYGIDILVRKPPSA